MDLWQEITSLRKALDEAISTFEKRGIEVAKSNAEYDRELQKAILKNKAAGVAATLVKDIAKGDEQIVAIKERVNITETLYEVSKEIINSYKVQIKVLNDQLSREWGKQ